MENNQEVGTATTENAGADTTPAIQNNEEVVKDSEEKVATTDSESNKVAPAEKTFTLTESQLMERAKRLAKEIVKDNSSETELKKELENVKGELLNYKKELAFSKYNLSGEQKEFVDYRVSKMVTNEKDFATALNEYMASEGKIFENKNTDEKPFVNVSEIKNVSGENEYVSLRESLRKGAGLK